MMSYDDPVKSQRELFNEWFFTLSYHEQTIALKAIEFLGHPVDWNPVYIESRVLGDMAETKGDC